MPWWQFLPYNALGAALWVGFWGALFYLLGGKAIGVGLAFKKLQFFLVAGLILFVAAVVIYLVRRRR
jgi:membrane protein DedA with SNARE-associated domain